MANIQAQFGFRHQGYLGGGSPDYQITPRAILKTYSTIIYSGDPVYKQNVTSNYIMQGTMVQSTTFPVLGVFQGCFYTPTGGIQIPTWSTWWPGGSAVDGVGYVVDAPNATFLVAASNTALTTGNIGNAINFSTGPTSGTTVAPTGGAGFSSYTVDQSTATTTGTTASVLPFKIVQLYQGVGNGADPTTAFNWVVVTYNQQIYKVTAGS